MLPISMTTGPRYRSTIKLEPGTKAGSYGTLVRAIWCATAVSDSASGSILTVNTENTHHIDFVERDPVGTIMREIFGQIAEPILFVL
jgi:hypothetical protein